VKEGKTSIPLSQLIHPMQWQKHGGRNEGFCDVKLSTSIGSEGSFITSACINSRF
jgi:hypothetical protein